ENMREVEALRRELAPHLKFLGSQVKKIEQAKVLAQELAERYAEYLGREEQYVRAERAELSAGKEGPSREHAELGKRIEHLRTQLSKKHGDEGAQELMRLEQESRDVARKQEAAMRELGSVEGELRAHERAGLSDELIPANDARTFAQKVISELEGGGNVKALIVLAKEFLRRLSERGGPSADVEALGRTKRELEKSLESLRAQEEAAREATARLRAQLESQKDQSREAERELFAAMARRSQLEGALAALRAREEMLSREEERYKSELREAGALVGTMPDV